MTNLIVVGFDEPGQADLAMAKVQDMAEGGLIDVENVCVVVRDQSGKASYRTTNPLPVPGAGTGAVLGGLWGLVLGALLVPFTGGTSAVAAETVAGMTWLGAVGGAAGAAMDRENFDDDFTSGIETLLRPGTSALCVLVHGYHVTDTDELLRRLHGLHGTVLRTNLSPAAEAKLQRALAGSA